MKRIYFVITVICVFFICGCEKTGGELSSEFYYRESLSSGDNKEIIDSFGEFVSSGDIKPDETIILPEDTIIPGEETFSVEAENVCSETEIETFDQIGKTDDETESFPDVKFYAVSDVNSLNVRDEPSLSSKVIGSLDKDDLVLYLGNEGEFIKTVYKERTAYVYTGYCHLMSVETSSLKAERAIDLGARLLGYPYVWGSQRYHWGNGVKNPNFEAGKFDCSALVQYVYYLSGGILLDLTTRTQINNGVPVERKDLKRGDLMFFTNASRKDKTGVERIGHVGIYFGNNYILHTASDHAVIEPISTARWNYFIAARRVTGE